MMKPFYHMKKLLKHTSLLLRSVLSLACALGLLLPVLFASSCQGDRLIEAEPVMVVEGWIAEGEFPVVFVTTSIPVSYERKSLDEIREHVLNWARVTISDGHNTEIMTGRINSRFDIKCYFTASNIRGRVGRTYHITVDYGDYHAEATTKINPAPRLDSLTVEKSEGCDTLYTVFAHVPQQTGTTGYYKFLTAVLDSTLECSSSYMGVFTDQNIGSGSKLPVYRSFQKALGKKFQPNFRSGEHVLVQFASIDMPAYNFWSAFDKNIVLSKTPFFPVNENLPSNIQGGIGIWYGYAVTQHYIVIP